MVAVFASLIGCAGLTQIKDPVSKFDQATHTVSSAEMAFLRAGQTLDCNYQFYELAFEFAADTAPKPAKSFVTSAQCTPNVLTDGDLLIRQKLLDAITLYADQLQAIAAGGADKTLASEGQTAATDFNNLMKNQDVLKAAKTTSLPADVEAAVVALFGMALTAKEFKEVKEAAAGTSGNLCEVVRTLEYENSILASNMSAKVATIGLELDTSIAMMKETGTLALVEGPSDPRFAGKPPGSPSAHLARTNDYGVLFSAVEARQILQSLGSLGGTATATPAAAPSCPSPLTKSQTAGSGTVQQLNAALEALLAANTAIANASSTGSLAAATSDFAARAQAAHSMATTLAK
jgi:hypothetical protein